MSMYLRDLLGGTPATELTSVEEWRSIGRPFYAQAVLREEYGVIPQAPAALMARVVRTDIAALDGLATVQEIEIVTKSPDSQLEALLITPNAVEPPKGCFLGLNFRGNHAVLDNPQIRPPLTKRLKQVDVSLERGADVAVWQARKIIERGYALATLFNGDAVPDDLSAASERLEHFAQFTKHTGQSDAPGALSCWAWSLSRVIDYLGESSLFDSNTVALVGHSRNGKAALLAGAFDERVALIIASQSGCGGAGPCRDIGEPWDKRETIKQITTAFPHWFCRNFKNYCENSELLPFDQHAVVALCAPRPVLISSAEDDHWANPPGSFAILQATDPVYRLLCDEGLEAQNYPQPGTLTESRLGHFLRKGGHAMTKEDWDAWLNYADIWL